MLGRILPFVNHYLDSFVQKEVVTPPVVMSFGYLVERVGCSVGQDLDQLFGCAGSAVWLRRIGCLVVQNRLFGWEGSAVWLCRIGCSAGQHQLFDY